MQRFIEQISFLIIFLGFILSCSEKEKVNPECTATPQLVVKTEDASCGGSDGKLILTASGGTEPYEFSINGVDYQTESSFNDLSSSAYTLHVRDKNLCSTSVKVILNENSTIVANFQTEVSTCGSNSGIILVNSTGGSGSHSYSIDDGAFQADNIFSNLAAGTYSVRVRDETGCTKTFNAEVKSNIDFATVIKPIVDNNCAIEGCHVQGNQIPDFTNSNTIKSNADNIKRKTADRSMPLKGSLTTEQIQQIACWVDDGAELN